MSAKIGPIKPRLSPAMRTSLRLANSKITAGGSAHAQPAIWASYCERSSLVRQPPKETLDGCDPSLDESESPPPTRTKAATEAGLSERQRKTALRVPNIPRQEFEEAVEAEEARSLVSRANL